jgi:hypothetical protein
VQREEKSVKANAEHRALLIARDMMRRGWNPVPVPVGKNPNRKEWQLLTITSENVVTHFNKPDFNCGIQFGPVSHDLSDVDLDCIEALRLARHFLPPTGSTYGRISKRESHWLYICECPEDRASIKWTDDEKKVICELRLGGKGKGAQSVAPGSVHPSGELYEWDKDGKQAQVKYEDLKAAVNKLAVASLLMRHWPEKGALHDTAQCVGGYLARAGWKASDTEHFVYSICREIRDVKEPKKHGKTAADSVKNFLQGGNTYGTPQMIAVFGQNVTDVVAKYLGRVPDHDGAVIRVIKGEIAKVADRAEAALLAASNQAPVLVRAGMLVMPIVERLPSTRNRSTSSVLLRPLKPVNIIYLLNKHAAAFERFDERRNGWVTIDPPPAVAQHLLERGEWTFPRVAGVITAPTLRPDGTVLDQPGYDQATQLWYAPDSDLRMPVLAPKPSRADALRSLLLYENLLVNFPFESDVDKSVTLAAAIGTVLRASFDVSPMYLFTAPDMGTGKSYLADVISSIVRGQPCPVITNCASNEEMEKRLGALVLAGVPMVSLDNCSTDIGGDLLCQITERPRVRVRILGKSEAPECDWRGVLFGTGNNVTLLGDMTRRGLVARLDARVERPELRSFNFDPVERVLADRGAYIVAAMTIARAYIAAGRPAKKGVKPLGSYGGWCGMVRDPLIWLGKDDPVQSMEAARQADPVRNALHTLIDVWRDTLQLNVGYAASDLIRIADTQESWDAMSNIATWEYPELRELLVRQGGTPRGFIESRKIGNWIMSVRGQVHDGYRIELVQKSEGHGNRFALVRVADASGG